MCVCVCVCVIPKLAVVCAATNMEVHLGANYQPIFVE